MSFAAGLSGLAANSAYLSTIGNNLANINTIGFKASTVTFMDLVSQTRGGTSANPIQVGLGVTTGSISPVFTQGAIENTGVSTNAAIQGNGFFVVADPNSDGNAYTRAGNFGLDQDGALITSDGWSVQGWTAVNADGTINTTGTPGDIVIPPGVLQDPTVTGQFSTVTNLDAGATAGDTFATSVQLYDSLGEAHVATITYTKAAGAGDWTWVATVPGAEITGGTAGTPFPIANGAAEFDANGALDNFTIVAGGAGGGNPPADVVITTPTWTNGAAASVLTWDVVDADGVSPLTGFGSPSGTSSVFQNGAPAGAIDSITMQGDGSIMATFGGGQSVIIGQLALASFNNPNGLVKLGSNRYGQSQAAGVANVGVAGTGGRGSLIGSALEQSNVDIAQEFTRMILAQRGYQANAKTITTVDEVLLETLQLKR